MSVNNIRKSDGIHRSKSDIGKTKIFDDATSIKSTMPFLKHKSQSSMQNSFNQHQTIIVDKDIRKRRKSIVNVGPGEILPESTNGSCPKIRVSSGSLFYGQVVAQQQLQVTLNSTNNIMPFENIGPGEILPESTNGSCPKIRVSSGSLSYGQVVAQQQLQATLNSTNNIMPFENVGPAEILPESTSGSSPKVLVTSGSFLYGEVVAEQKLQAKRNSTTNDMPFENVGPHIKTQWSFCVPRKVREYFDMPMQQVIFLIFWAQVCVSMHLYYLIMTLKCPVSV